MEINFPRKLELNHSKFAHSSTLNFSSRHPRLYPTAFVPRNGTDTFRAFNADGSVVPIIESEALKIHFCRWQHCFLPSSVSLPLISSSPHRSHRR